ncbi:MAG TPA: glucoamylase family protein [Thermoanaerobaculia bacterium]
MTRREGGGGGTSVPSLRFSGAHPVPAAALAFLLFLSPACRPAAAPPPSITRPAPVVAPRPAGQDERILDLVERRTFDFFWDLANPENGLVPDRWPTKSFSSVAAIGFGLTAYPIGVERGYVTREDARRRVLTTLQFLSAAPQGPSSRGITGYKGFFYHFLDMKTGERFETVELSTIDTTLLLAGVLFCGSYFDADDPAEEEIRSLADSLYRRVEWDWAQPHPPLVNHGWKPEVGFLPYDWGGGGYDESMILYVLALGSPTHAIAPDAWNRMTRNFEWTRFHGQEYVPFNALFGYQYSQLWIDFHGIQDSFSRSHGIDYFENSRRATYAHRAYAIANPGGWRGYGETIWGLTACDGPADVTVTIDGKPRTFHTYWARGCSTKETTDDGTIAPTAAASSIAFAPEIAIPAIEEMQRRYGENLFTKYGFLDSFNPTLSELVVPLHHGRVEPGLGWFDGDYLGIDQGPIVAMIENYRSGLVWKTMRKNPHVVRGLTRAGFTGGWLSTASQN